MEFLIGIFYFNQPMKKSSLFAASVNTTTKKWSVDADVPLRK
jgi:hypothetical protein